jgi:rubrerythrin
LLAGRHAEEDGAPASPKELAVPEKPRYLGLLNAIAVAEGRAQTYLCAWAEVTPSDEVRRVLRTVAAREGDHAMSFARRINELGFDVRHKDDKDQLEKTIALVTSTRSDLEKMKALKLHRLDTTDKPDIFDDIFKDHTIDIQTGALLGRYIAEERDSGRMLRRCYEQLKLHVDTSAPTAPATSNGRLEAKVDGLRRAVDELRQTVCAQFMPTKS